MKLEGLKVIDLSVFLPGPYLTLAMADHGADVIKVEPPGGDPGREIGLSDGPHTVFFRLLNRGKKSVMLDLKTAAGREALLRLCEDADVFVESFRPGVTERLGVGPDDCLTRNPRLVYGRMTGWGQDGPLANAAGHDINYISITGALAAIGTKDAPVPPLNLVGDFGGGALYLVVGVLAALLEASKSGKGQVVDAAMCDGAASLMSMFFDLTAIGRWREGRERNCLDGGAHFYGVYECACGNFISIGSIEPQFYALLREHAGLSDAAFDAQMDNNAWPALKEKLKAVFKSKTREDWCKIMEGTDICFAPVLTMAEATQHPHMVARKVFVERHGVKQPAPAPRFSRTPSAIREPEVAELGAVTKAWSAGK